MKKIVKLIAAVFIIVGVLVTGYGIVNYVNVIRENTRQSTVNEYSWSENSNSSVGEIIISDDTESDDAGVFESMNGSVLSDGSELELSTEEGVVVNE